jgi:hypothetical protein
MLSCQTAPKPAQIEARQVLSLAELERAEFEQPKDPSIKMNLGQMYWCAGKRGMALEAWRWVGQFSKSRELKAEAKELVGMATAATKDDPDLLEAKLRCNK